jgi:hypothetical protein
MKKSMSVIALAVLAATAQAGELSAGKDTKFEVNVELGAYHLSKKDSSGVAGKDFLGKGMNQIEIKASHNLNSDVTVFGEIEVDYDPIVDNNTVKTDDVKLGFKHKDLGTFMVGQFDSFYEDNVVEALGIGHGDTGGFMTEPASSNDGRHVQYLKQIGNLTLVLDGTFSKGTGTSTDTGMAIAASYKLSDQLSWTAGYSDIAKYKTDDSSTSANSDKKSLGMAVVYKFGDSKLTGMHTQATSTSDVKTKYTGVALTHKMGAFDVGVSAQQVKAGTAASRNEFGLGFGYEVYKNMTAYLDISRLKKANNEGDAVEIGVKYAF